MRWFPKNWEEQAGGNAVTSLFINWAEGLHLISLFKASKGRGQKIGIQKQGTNGYCHYSYKQYSRRKYNFRVHHLKTKIGPF